MEGKTGKATEERGGVDRGEASMSYLHEVILDAVANNSEKKKERQGGVG